MKPNGDINALFTLSLEQDISTLVGTTDSFTTDIALCYLLGKHRKRLVGSDEHRARQNTECFNKFRRNNLEAWYRGSLISLTSDEISQARFYIRNALEQYTTDAVGDIQNVLNLNHMLRMWRFGPGKSLGVKYSSFYDKIHAHAWTVTPGAASLAKLLVFSDPYLLTKYKEGRLSFKSVKGSKLSTVPKNEEEVRTICTEPLLNMALQLAAGSYVEGALRTIGYDITRQQCDTIEKESATWVNKFHVTAGFEYYTEDYINHVFFNDTSNQALAMLSSVTRHLCTLDLSAASDLISLNLIELLWPPEWCSLFRQIRSPTTEVEGEVLELNMLSTMGNGFTFPVMTLTLLALVSISASKMSRQTHAVFGDDIIVPSDEYHPLLDVLGRAGLIVNKSKSFRDIFFRESCGADFFLGVDVKPFYVQYLDSAPDVYIAINQLLEWQAKHKVVLHHTLEYLLSVLHDLNSGRKPLIVPLWEQPYAGIKTATIEGRKKYNRLVLKKRTLRRGVRQHVEDLLCILGGYCTSTGDKLEFEPRPMSDQRPEYKFQRSVLLPKGNRTGWIACDGDRSGIFFTAHLLESLGVL